MPPSTAARACAARANTCVPGGVFGLWLDDPPHAAFQAEPDAVFARSQAHVVRFAHPLQDREVACSVDVARTAPAG